MVPDQGLLCQILPTRGMRKLCDQAVDSTQDHRFGTKASSQFPHYSQLVLGNFPRGGQRPIVTPILNVINIASRVLVLIHDLQEVDLGLPEKLLMDRDRRGS